ncbi:MAG: tRNA dihydrouridine synthase DusB [Candidatus Schekmanbacteria bacterium]|nr:MAG: tRNA dihydrouridine synthase DusB [Candidatus Schekmanbacteria bacterium]
MKLNSFKIGKIKIYPPIILAPIAGWTNLPFRIIACEKGAGLTYTELISSEAIVRKNKKTLKMLTCDEREGNRVIQIFGANPDVMARAAKIVEDMGEKIIDINMGCSVKKVIKNGAGAYLLKSAVDAKKIMKAVVSAVSLPVTVKIRSGWNDRSINAVEISKIAEECGISAITVHPRTAVQYFKGTADWNIIKEVKQNVSIPVIGNGDVKTEEDVKRMFEETDCDAVMIGRGALGNPWIFKRAEYFITKGEKMVSPSIKEIRDTMIKHLKLNIEIFGEKRGISLFKKHSASYVKGMRGAIDFRKKIFLAKSESEAKDIIRKFFSALS